ncbi:MAG: metallophosphoesterase [Myxococcota bacterium]|nr:metallophosphoesterase [Myxococcota bacterium]
MRIAHFSDLHLLSLDGVPVRRFMNKRITGWVNLRLKRASIHRSEYVRAIAREIGARDFDHVVVTGDLTNLALESEYDLARDVLERDLGLDPSRVTVVPGNHDVYTRGALSCRRFERYFAPWLIGDLPELAVDVNGGFFPVVKLRGSVAIIGLSSAVPRPPMVAAGELGLAQIAALHRVLEHPEVARRTAVLGLHHPAVRPESRAKMYLEGLRDASALVAELRPIANGLLLHGHLHRRVQRDIPTSAGRVHQVGATSASLHHAAAHRMAGFNVYEIGEAGVDRVEAYVYSPERGTFHLESVPKHV